MRWYIFANSLVAIFEAESSSDKHLVGDQLNCIRKIIGIYERQVYHKTSSFHPKPIDSGQHNKKILG